MPSELQKSGNKLSCHLCTDNNYKWVLNYWQRAETDKSQICFPIFFFPLLDCPTTSLKFPLSLVRGTEVDTNVCPTQSHTGREDVSGSRLAAGKRPASLLPTSPFSCLQPLPVLPLAAVRDVLAPRVTGSITGNIARQ